MKNVASYRNNLVFFIFLILIPAFALNASFYFLEQIDENWAKKEQEKRAVQEVETLASEAAFDSQFSALFRGYFDVIKSDFSINFGKDYFLTSHLEQSAKAVFREPFPNYNLYVFKKANSDEAAELVYHHGTLKGGRRGLGFAFDHIYNLSTNAEISEVKAKSNEAFAKKLLGPYTPINAIAKEMRGLTTYAKSNNKFSWFIWDYDEIPGKGVIGAVLTCDEIENHDECGRLLALRNLKSRGRAIGAFIPIFKDFGAPLIQAPLDKSRIFLDWAKSIAIDDHSDLYRWAKASLPKAVPLGNYTAFCHLGRGSTHAAVILVKALPAFSFPKWLIVTNYLFVFLLALLLILGFGYGIWPSINLSLRFSLAYILASILPLSLLGVTAYGYILQYQHTVINQTNTELETTLKSFDTQKSAIVNEYINAFTQAINDERLLKLIKEKGVKDELVARRVVDIFENKDSGNYLPILGVKIFDESGEGAYAGSNSSTNYDAKAYVESTTSSYVELLRTKLKFDDPDAESWMKKYENNSSNDFAARAYVALIGETMTEALLKYTSVPVARKNDNFYSFQVYDYIKIDGKARYIMLVVWDDNALDASILENAFNKQALKNIKQNFLGFRIKGQNLETIGRKTRHASQKVLAQATDLAKLVNAKKRLDTYSDNENIIVAVPSDNFNQTILVGWVSNDDLLNDIASRKQTLFFFILISLIVLGICIVRSVKVFLKPVNTLKNALDDVSSENLNISLESRSLDELGRLSDEFSSMIEGLRERDRLSRLISDKAVQALKKKNEGLLNDTETFEAVVLVSDIRNFTGMSEEYDPIMITDLLNEHFAEMARVISDNGGLIYKFIGDAIEAIFPEKEELEFSAKERAFKAGCMMVATLATINSRRRKRELFTYKIGVGLCYGTIHAGTVGSVETRLDYAILGEALEQAAEFEALSIQNPLFPLVVGEDIAEKLAVLGLSFRKLDTNGKDVSAYTLDEIKNEAAKEVKKIFDFSGFSEDKKVEKEENKNQELKTYSLQPESRADEVRKTLLFALIMVFSITLFITVGVNVVYFTGFNSLKSESDSECARLFEQINCDDALKAAFESLCVDFYGELDVILKDKDSNEPLDNLVKPVTKKYEALGRPITKYYCCRLSKAENTIKPEDTASIGFSADTCNKIASIALAFREVNRGYFESSVKQECTRAIHALMGNMTSEFSMRSSHFRRSALTDIEGEEIFVNTNRFFPPKYRNDCYGYAFCGISPEVPKESLLNYYSIYAGTDYLLAFKTRNKWHFSADFPDEEKDFLKNNFNNEATLKSKGYSKGETKLEEEDILVFAITRKLASYHYSPLAFNLFIILVSLISFGSLGYVFSKKIILLGSSLAAKLRLDIIIAAILPLITVTFVSYLYVNEEYNVKKADKYLELQNQMDSLESKYTYYRPFCWYYIDKVIRSDDFKNAISNLNNAKSEKEQKNAKLALRRLLKKQLVGNGRDLFVVDPYFIIKEAIIFGNKNWSVSVTDEKKSDENESNISDFTKILVEASRTNFFKNEGSFSASTNAAAAKGEIIVENFIKALSSAFGNDVGLRVLNHPGNPIMMSAVYTAIGSIIIPFPNPENPEYVMINLVRFSNESLPYTASLINNRVPIGAHLASGSVGEESYVFYSPDILIGQQYYYNVEEVWELVRELTLASAWINAGKLPVFKTVDIQGPKFFVCRKGNLIGDCLVAAFSSEKPVREGVYKNIIRFAFIIIISIIMIYLIAQSIVSDLLAPIRRLIIGAKSAARGDYSFRADYYSEDELGRLCESFDKMMKGLEEKQLMNRMVSKTALNVTTGVADVQSKKIESVLMYVTVPGFAEIMKKASPYELFLDLRNQIATLAEIVLKEGGDIDKIMGEKLLIAFQSNEKTEGTLAADACRAAYLIGICEKLPFKVAIGINQGRVISGFLGVGEKRDFTVIGDPVNVAARIASCAENMDSGHCLISETIYKLVSKDIKAEKQGEVALKGKSQPMVVYRLL